MSQSIGIERFVTVCRVAITRCVVVKRRKPTAEIISAVYIAIQCVIAHSHVPATGCVVIKRIDSVCSVRASGNVAEQREYAGGGISRTTNGRAKRTVT